MDTLKVHVVAQAKCPSCKSIVTEICDSGRCEPCEKENGPRRVGRSKAARLKKSAYESATWHGHIMSHWRTWVDGQMQRSRFTSECVLCNRGMQVILRPLPNEIDISGEAVAVDCDRTWHA